MWTERDLNSRNKAMKMLENEHHYLRYLMEEWHPIVLDFENDRFEEKEDAVLAFQALRNKLKDFIEPWKKHTDKEGGH